MFFLLKFFLIASAVCFFSDLAEAKGKKTKKLMGSAAVRTNTCPSGLEGKTLDDVFPWYTHDGFERSATPTQQDPVTGPVLNPFTKGLKINGRTYQAYAIDEEKLGGRPSVDVLEPLVDMDKLSSYQLQELPIKNRCFIYVEEKDKKKSTASNDKDQGNGDTSNNESHKAVLLLIANQSRRDVGKAVEDLIKTSESMKSSSKGASSSEAKSPASDEEPSSEEDESQEENIFGKLTQKKNTSDQDEDTADENDALDNGGIEGEGGADDAENEEDLEAPEEPQGDDIPLNDGADDNEGDGG